MPMANKVSQSSASEFQQSISDAIELNFQNPIHFNEIQEISKKRLHPLVFLLNIFWMILSAHACLYYIYAPITEGEMKGKLAGIVLGSTVAVALPTFWYLTSFVQFIKLAFMIDTIQLAAIIAGLSFVSMIVLFDQQGSWDFKLIEVGFSIETLFSATMVRVMLVTLDWSKWQVIVFKIHSMMNCLMFLICGVYFICADFSYTNHLLKSFDKKVHDFMVLFIFSMFSFIYQFYRKITDLDYTGALKYSYKIKNVDENRNKKTKDIAKKRMESLKSLQVLEKSDKAKQSERRKYKKVFKFVQNEVMNGILLL